MYSVLPKDKFTDNTRFKVCEFEVDKNLLIYHQTKYKKSFGVKIAGYLVNLALAKFIE